MANRNNTLLIKRSNIPDKIPPLSGLTLGELGLNTADAKLYTLYTSGTTGATEVRQIGWDRLSTTGGTINGDLTVTGSGTFNSVSATTYYNLPPSTFSGGTVTGPTDFTAGLTATTISASTYYNLPLDVYVTGATYSNNTFIFTNNTGGTFNTTFNDVTGLTVNGNVSISGATQPGGYALSVTGDTNFDGDVYVQGDLYYSGSVVVTGSTIIEDGLTANTIYTDYIDFNTGATVTPQTARLTWNETDGTLDLGMKGGLVTQQIGQETYYPPVVNKTGSILYQGTLVMINPSAPSFGNRLSVAKAVSDGTYPSYALVGVLTEDISDNQEGFATWFGYVRDLKESDLETQGIKPSGETWSVGEILWANPTLNGGYTNIEPSSPNLKVPIAAITDINGSNIILLVRPTLTPSLRDVNNVKISGATNGDLLSLNETSNVWESTKTLNGSYTITGDTNVGGTLNIGTIGGGTSIGNLGFDSNGQVVTGTTASGVNDANKIFSWFMNIT